MLLAGTVLLTVATLLAGCSADHPAPAPVTVTNSVTLTRSPSATVPAPASVPTLTTVAPLPPGVAVPAGERESDCPYIDTATARDLEGNRIYRTTVTTAPGPVTCRFYFWCCDYHATLEIAPFAMPSADAAYNAMVETGRAGANVTGVKDLVPGVDAVLFQTAFYGPDAGRDWACAFAKGTTLVVVRTNQTDVSFNARRIAETVAPRF